MRSDLGCAEAWMQAAGRHALLSASEEIRLGHLIQRGQAPDASPLDQRRGQRAKQRMITSNLRLVILTRQTPAMPRYRATNPSPEKPGGHAMGIAALLLVTCQSIDRFICALGRV